jgi:CRP-like cAMP-binding protein
MSINPFWGNIFKRKTSSQEETISILKQVPLFQELSYQELLKIERIVHKRTFVPGEEIFRENEPGMGMYIIKSGVVDICQASKNGVPQKLATLREGDFFGEMALLDEAPRAASAVAQDDCEVIGFFKPDLFDLIERDPRLGLKIVIGVAKMLSVRLRRTNEQLREMESEVFQLKQKLWEGQAKEEE